MPLVAFLIASAAGLDPMLEAYASGRPGGALRLAEERLAAGDDPAARLVRLLALVDTRRWEEALDAIADVETNGPPLGNWGIQLRSQAHAAMGDCDAAESTARRLGASSVFRTRLWPRLVTCWLEQQDVARAEAAVEQLADAPAPGDGYSAGVLLLRGRVRQAGGDARGARDVYRELIVRFPFESAARSANELLATLRGRGIGAAPLTADEQLALADAERARQKSREAKRLYRAVKARSGTRQPVLYQKAELGMVELDIVDMAYGRALRRLEPLLHARDADVQARARYLEGDVLARRGRIDDSLSAWSSVLEATPAAPFAVEAAISGARVAYAVRDFARARAFAEWLLARPDAVHPETVVGDDGVHRGGSDARELYAHALWLMAWIERRSDGPLAAMDSYLAQIPTDGLFGEAALYWRARLALESGDREAATLFADLLAERAPTSYYALLAADLLGAGEAGKLLPSLASAVGAAPARPATQPEDLLGAVTMLELGLAGSARDLLRQVPIPELSPADRLAAAWLYHRSGQPHFGAVLARRPALGPREEVQDPALFQLAYPRPFDAIVEQQAGEYGVPVDLLYAIMREESSFNPSAMSPRKARGLMQMIPPTAYRLAREAQLRRFRPRQLFQPPTSVRLGAHYVASLLSQFDGNIVAAIASYHAGEDAVERWLTSRAHLSPDELIEEIPYMSTRTYVKKVLASYGIYRLLYQESPPSVLGLPLAPRLLSQAAGTLPLVSAE